MDAFEAMIQQLEELADEEPKTVIEDADDLDYLGEDVYEDEEDPYYAEMIGNLNPYKDEEGPESEVSTVEVGGGEKKEVQEEVGDSYGIYPEKKVLRSMILEFFTPEQLLELEKLSRSLSISSNKKVKLLEQKLTEWGIPYAPLNPGTNRFGIQLDGCCMKIALDSDGKIDNKREFKYSQSLYPLVIKCYEVSPDGLVAVFEYIEVWGIDDYYKNQDKMREILTKIAANYLIGDVGVSSVNYLNWGYRGDEICILDFAYIYSTSYQTFRCTCKSQSVLHYDKDFNNLICPSCGKKYAFKDIRKRISRKMQEEEIGDIMEQGYVLSSSEEVVDFVPKFTYGAEDRIRKHLLKLKKRSDKNYKEEKQIPGKGEAMSPEEIIAAIESGEIKIEEE